MAYQTSNFVGVKCRVQFDKTEMFLKLADGQTALHSSIPDVLLIEKISVIVAEIL